MKNHMHSVAGDRTGAHAKASNGLEGAVRAFGFWNVLAFDPDGNLVAEDAFQNLVVNEGLNHLLSVALAGGAQQATWYLGLMQGSPTPAAGDTMASHAGWTEQTGYDEAARPTWTPGAVAAQSVDNSGAVASVTVTANGTTFGGAFLTPSNTKGGTSGILYAAGAFTGGDITLSAGSTIQVTATFTQAAA